MQVKKCHAIFFPLSFFLLHLPIASSPASREHQMFSLSSYLLLYPTVLWQPTQTRRSRGTNKSLAHFGAYREFISGVVLAVGRGPQFHYAVSPPEPAPFKTCYRNSRISPRWATPTAKNTRSHSAAPPLSCLLKRLIPALSAPTWWS